MFGKRILTIVLVVLLGAALFNALGSSQYNTGWSQGYAAGQQAAGEGQDAPPAAPASPDRDGRPYGPGWGFFPFWGIGGLFFKLFFIVLLFGLFSRLFGWRGRGPGGWHRHHHRDEHDIHEKTPEDVMKAQA